MGDFRFEILDFGLNPKSKTCSERSESIQNPKFKWMASLGVGLVVLVGLLIGQERWAARPVATPQSVPAPSLQSTPAGSFLRDYADLAPAPTSGDLVAPSAADVVEFLLKFGIVLLALYGSLRGLRTLMARQRWLPTSGTQVTVVETAHLSPRRALYVVRAGRQKLLLGGTDHEITLLAELDEEDQPGAQSRSEAFAAHLAAASETIDVLQNGGIKGGVDQGRVERGRKV